MRDQFVRRWRDQFVRDQFVWIRAGWRDQFVRGFLMVRDQFARRMAFPPSVGRDGLPTSYLAQGDDVRHRIMLRRHTSAWILAEHDPGVSRPQEG